MQEEIQKYRKRNRKPMLTSHTLPLDTYYREPNTATSFIPFHCIIVKDIRYVFSGFYPKLSVNKR